MSWTVTALADQEQRVLQQFQNIGIELEKLGVTPFLKDDKYVQLWNSLVQH